MTIPTYDLYRLVDNFIGDELRADNGKAFKHYTTDGWSVYFDPDTQDLATLARIAAGEAYYWADGDDSRPTEDGR